MYRIVLAEDHALVREGIKKIVEDFDDLQVVGEVGDALQLLELLKTLPVDMVVLDISMPGMPGIVAAKEIKRRYPQVRVLILTMHKKKEYLNDAIAAGADGYLLKEDVARELGSAIDKIRRGTIYISPLLSNELTSLFVQSRRVVPETPEEPLTPREIEIIKLIAEGKSSREIAAELFLSFRTIQNHRTRIMRKLSLKKNTDLVKYAIQMGFISAGGL
ncbi:MAG: response regulator transcription factor [Deltaproteobacteria bacterium]|nr:response regulator transcription factor [Deltaproteobacteria bacterium]